MDTSEASGSWQGTTTIANPAWPMRRHTKLQLGGAWLHSPTKQQSVHILWALQVWNDFNSQTTVEKHLKTQLKYDEVLDNYYLHKDTWELLRTYNLSQPWTNWERFPIWDRIRKQETRGYPSLEFTGKPLKVVSTYVQWPSRATCLQWSWPGYHPIPQTSGVPSRGCKSRSYIYQHTEVLSQEQQLQEDSAHMMQASSTNQIKPN
jgi:hypothetical protein